jgi:nucleoid-associated protein YgaU
MTKKLSILSIGALFGVYLMLATGCSSGGTGDEMADELPTADAGTDAVPKADAEVAAAPDAGMPTDGSMTAPPVDQTPPPASPDMAQTPPPVDAPAPVVAQQTPPVDTAPAPVAAPAPAPETPSASSGSGESYTVQHGDTLMRIAFDHYGDLYKWKSIYEANRNVIKDPNVITPGTVLTIAGGGSGPATPSGEKYEIKQGDTLGKISNQVYGTPSKWKKIWDNNRASIPNPNKIFAGFYLYYLPEAGGQDQAPAPAPQPLAGGSGGADQTARAPSSQ